MRCSIEFKESTSSKDACFRVNEISFNDWTGVQLRLTDNDATELYEKENLRSCQESDQKCTEWCKLTTADQLESSILFEIKNDSTTICSAEVSSNQAVVEDCSSLLESIYEFESDEDKIAFIEKLSATENTALNTQLKYRWTTTNKCYRIQKGSWDTWVHSGHLQYRQVLYTLTVLLLVPSS